LFRSSSYCEFPACPDCELQGEITVLPWAELEGLHSETSLIKEQLLALNAAGYLTINSQPALNGLPSSDGHFGWGGPGGYVYQKAYVEFFCAPEKLQPLLDKLDTAAAITYIAVNAQGDVRSNMKEDSVNAVTWGVFPGGCCSQQFLQYSYLGVYL
jgi:methylenetetrahydrofolate reductase (NADPH)